MYEDLKEWMPEFHKTGAKLFVQLTAGFGRSFTISEMMEKLYTNKALRVLSKPFMDLDKILRRQARLRTAGRISSFKRDDKRRNS